MPTGWKDKSKRPFQLSTLNSQLSTELPPHGCAIYRLEAEQCLPRTLYEAETAYLSCYQELSNPLAVGTAYYTSDPECSGGMKAVNLGNAPENDLQWRDVFVQHDGEYNVTIRCSSFDNKATLFVSANNGKGQRFKSDDLRDGSVRLTLNLNKGQNTIRLYNDNGPMPDIDYMQIDF